MKGKILFIYTNYSTFVKTDFAILSSEYEVKKYCFKPVKGVFPGLLQIIRQFIYLLVNGWKYDRYFIWFADYHSLLPVGFSKLFGKKVYIVIGGYDACRIRSLRYGVFVSKFRGFFAIRSIRNSTLNLTVSGYVDRRIKAIAPRAPRKLIYNCVNMKAGNPVSMKKDIVLTIGLVNNEQTFYRKGIDTFIEVAGLLPEYRFVMIGITASGIGHLLQGLPSNLELFDRVEQEKLTGFYSEAKVYAQFSRMDTFCLTLAEAMLFGCFPVITNEGGMPEVVGNKGMILKRDAEAMARSIRTALRDYSPEEAGSYSRRILEYFSFDRRKKLLLEALR